MHDSDFETSSFRPVDCPYCAERFEIAVDLSAGDADYIEDCPICCRPIEFSLRIGTSGGWRLEARREAD